MILNTKLFKTFLTTKEGDVIDLPPETKIDVEITSELPKIRRKSTPLKPIYKIEEGYGHEYHLCGFCKRGVVVTWNYCPYCGQALDWRK